MTDIETGPGPLGRLLEHDPRSRRYPFSAAPGATIRTVMHLSRIPILNQGDVGSCTGHATVGALGCEPFFPTIRVTLDDALAVKVYSTATGMDPWPGEYPPTDTGSSGLAAAKAALQFGLITGYRHAFSIDAALAALMERPVITGIPWMSSFDTPDVDGLVKLSTNAFARGGHEITATGYDANRGWVWFKQSWGPRWGKAGTFAMSVADWTSVLNDRGDVTVFEPLGSPPPGPIPTPADAMLMDALDPWASSKMIWSRFTKAGKAVAAYRAWKAANNYPTT